MVKRKKPTHNLITEALATANPTSGLNPKAVLLYLNRTNSVENDDEVSSLFSFKKRDFFRILLSLNI
jgi:hypothetical protein